MDLSPQIREYIQGRLDDKLEKHDKAASKALEKAAKEGGDSAALELTQTQQRIELQDKHKPAHWLDDAADRAKQVSFVTHPAKYTHGANRASSIPAVYDSPRAELLGSYSLRNIGLDVVGNAAALDVANMLLLGSEGQVLAQQLQAKNTVSLEPLAKDLAQLHAWLAGFSQALTVLDMSSHSLAKQMYFPIAEGEYHLISPFYSSPLIQGVHDRVRDARFSEGAKNSRAQRKTEKGCADDVLYFPGLLRMSFGGANAQNVSLNNKRRGGGVYLLPSAPPVWDNKLLLPTERKDSFWRLYNRRADKVVRRLRLYLASVAHRSTNRDTKRRRELFVTELMGEFLQLVAELRQLGGAGWSQDTKLPLHEQCLLDPQRNDRTQGLQQGSDFDRMIDDKSWLDVVADDYGRWLNSRLSQIKTKQGELLRDMADAEAQLWRQELDRTLSYLRNDLEHLL